MEKFKIKKMDKATGEIKEMAMIFSSYDDALVFAESWVSRNQGYYLEIVGFDPNDL